MPDEGPAASPRQERSPIPRGKFPLRKARGTSSVVPFFYHLHAEGAMGKKPADSFGTRTRQSVGKRTYEIFRMDALERRGVGNVSRLPLSLKGLLENLLRHEDGTSVRSEDIEALARWEPGSPPAPA